MLLATISLGVDKKVLSVHELALEKMDGVKLVAVIDESRFLLALASRSGTGTGGA
jgi:hypothetical protein